MAERPYLSREQVQKLLKAEQETLTVEDLEKLVEKLKAQLAELEAQLAKLKKETGSTEDVQKSNGCFDEYFLRADTSPQPSQNVTQFLAGEIFRALDSDDE